MASHEVAIMVTERRIDTTPRTARATWRRDGPSPAFIDAGVFDISAAGMLTFKESPDYEMPADAEPTTHTWSP